MAEWKRQGETVCMPNTVCCAMAADGEEARMIVAAHNAEVDELRGQLADAEAKIERQRKNLNQLYTANTALREERDQLDAATKKLNEWSADATVKLAAMKQPVGWELDEDEVWRDLQLAISDRMNDAHAFRITIESVRARIKPVYECKECAEWEKDCRALSAASRSIDARIAARAALEGEA